MIDTITIKQPTIYIDFASDDWVKPYDHILVSCECGNLMEKGMGLCNKCIDHESLKMQATLVLMVKGEEK